MVSTTLDMGSWNLSGHHFWLWNSLKEREWPTRKYFRTYFMRYIPHNHFHGTKSRCPTIKWISIKADYVYIYISINIYYIIAIYMRFTPVFSDCFGCFWLLRILISQWGPWAIVLSFLWPFQKDQAGCRGHMWISKVCFSQIFYTC